LGCYKTQQPEDDEHEPPSARPLGPIVIAWFPRAFVFLHGEPSIKADPLWLGSLREHAEGSLSYPVSFILQRVNLPVDLVKAGALGVM
jgi:hypothetical protein